MVHVFNEEEKKMEQVHIKKLPQKPMTKMYKRQKNSEYVKFLLHAEAERVVAAVAKKARRVAVAGTKA